jgi:hypothetical protein
MIARYWSADSVGSMVRSQEVAKMTAVIGLILGALCFVLPVATPAISAEKLRVAYPTLAGPTPSRVTHELGIWKRSGLDVEFILVSGGASIRGVMPERSSKEASVAHDRGASIAAASNLYGCFPIDPLRLVIDDGKPFRLACARLEGRSFEIVARVCALSL